MQQTTHSGILGDMPKTKSRIHDCIIAKMGLCHFLDKVEKYDRDEDTFVAFLAIKAAEDDEAWELFPHFIVTGAEYTWSKYVEHHRNFKSENYVFYPIPDERLLITMSMTFTVKAGKIYSPVGISKSVLALLLAENIKKLKQTGRAVPADASRLSALSVQSNALTAKYVLTHIDSSISYCITRPEPVMSFIIMKAMNDTFVSLGSVTDRTFIEIMRQDYPGSTSHMGKQNGLGDVVDILKASGPPVLDDSNTTWEITSFDTGGLATWKVNFNNCCNTTRLPCSVRYINLHASTLRRHPWTFHQQPSRGVSMH